MGWRDIGRKLDPRNWSGEDMLRVALAPVTGGASFLPDDILFGEKVEPGLEPGAGRLPSTDKLTELLTGRMTEQRDPFTMDRSRLNQIAAQQQGQISGLEGIASGAQESAGAMAARRAQVQGENAIRSMAAGARGLGAGGASRNAMRQIAQLTGDAAGQRAQAQAADSQAARQTIAGILGQRAGLEGGLAQAGLQSLIQQRGMDDARQQAAIGTLIGLESGNVGRDIQVQQYLDEIERQNAFGGIAAPALQTGGMVLGGMAGGPQGAMIGGQVGGMAGGMVR